MVPGSRNPMWGEEFNFSVDELPVQVLIMVYFCYGLEFISVERKTIMDMILLTINVLEDIEKQIFTIFPYLKTSQLFELYY